MSAGRDSVLDSVRLAIEERLEEISRILPDGYLLTFIARHGSKMDFDICITEDESLDRIIRIVENLKKHGHKPGPLNLG